jgi:hypothetical protein
VTEAAQLLHDRDILQITFAGTIHTDALRKLLRLLASDTEAVRARGGPAEVWAAEAVSAIAIEQVDYRKVLEDREAQQPRHDNIWTSIIRSIVDGKKTFDEIEQQRLLEIAGDVGQIHELATAVMAPKCGADGSSILTTQAATVLAAFRHLATIVSVKAGDRMPEVIETSRRPQRPRSRRHADDRRRRRPRRAAWRSSPAAAAFGDVRSRGCSRRRWRPTAPRPIASRRCSIRSPDIDRKRRVLSLAKAPRIDSTGDQFTVLWTSMEERSSTTRRLTRPRHIARRSTARRAGRGHAQDLPEELPGGLRRWAENVAACRSSAARLAAARTGSARQCGASDVGSLADDLLIAGAYADVDPRDRARGRRSRRIAGADGRARAARRLGSSDSLRDRSPSSTRSAMKSTR